MDDDVSPIPFEMDDDVPPIPFEMDDDVPLIPLEIGDDAPPIPLERPGDATSPLEAPVNTSQTLVHDVESSPSPSRYVVLLCV